MDDLPLLASDDVRARILYAVGECGRVVPLALHNETSQEARRRLQRTEDRRAKRAGRVSETVYVWSPQKDDVVDMPLLRSVGRRFGVGH